jgi:hypothetical protein
VDEAQDFSANMIRAMLAHLAPDYSVTLRSTPHNVIPSVATPIRATFRSWHRHQSGTLPEPGPAPSPLREEGYISLRLVTSTKH